MKTALFGGEGLFFAILEGPGTVGFNLFHLADWRSESLQQPHKRQMV